MEAQSSLFAENAAAPSAGPSATSIERVEGPDPFINDPGLARRAKAMACTLPLHHLESSKAHMRDGEFSVYTLWDLAFVAIDAVTARMDFDTGADQDEVVAEVTPWAARQRPDRPAQEHAEVARWVVDELIGTSTQRGFTVPYGDWDREQYKRRIYDFKLLEQHRAADGIIHLRATDQAINVLVGALDTDVESAQAAAEAKLEHLVRRGRLSDAELAADQARLQTIRLGEQLRRDVAAAQRDLSTVNWAGDISARIDRALDHITERLEAETRISTNLRHTLDAAETAQLRASAQRVIELLKECMDRHTDLQRRLLGFRDVFLAEQERQLFRPAAADIRLVNLTEDLLLPALRLPLRDAERPCLTFFTRVMGTAAPRPLRLTGLIEALLQPPAERQLLGAELIEPELVIRQQYEAFSDDERAVAERLLAGVGEHPTRLSALLADALQHSDGAAHCVALQALRAFAVDLATPGRYGEHCTVLVAYSDGRTLPGAVPSAPEQADCSLSVTGSERGEQGTVPSLTPNPFRGDDLLIARAEVNASTQQERAA